MASLLNTNVSQYNFGICFRFPFYGVGQNAVSRADLRRLLRRGTNSFSGLSGIGTAGSRQNALHSVVSLVTRVFDQTVIRMPQRDLHGPWFEPRVRIVERHRPRKIIRSSALEALDHVKLFA